MLNRLIIAAICILTLLLALGGAMRSPSYEDCETENSYDASGQKKNGALYLTPPGVVDGLGTWAECLSVVANKNGDAITGLATVLLTLVTGGLVWLAADQSNTSRAELRAYVKLSHVSPGLVGLDERFPVTGTVVIAVQAKNSGQTPATVTDVFLKVFSAHKSATLPPRPDYTGERPPHDVTRGFLVAGDDFIHHRQFTFEKEHAEPIAKGEKILYLIGYVDYIDIFGRRHRGGYARMYDPALEDTTNNLSFVSLAGYNYDRLRSRGEGRDWSEKH